MCHDHMSLAFAGRAAIAFAFLTIPFVSAQTRPVDANQELAGHLSQITDDQRSRTSSLTAAEAKMLALLDSYNSPEDRGQVYYEVAMMYNRAAPQNSDQAARFAGKALEQPQPPRRASQLHSLLAGERVMQYRRAGAAEAPTLRREALRYQLQALSELIATQKPMGPGDVRKVHSIYQYPPEMDRQQREQSEKEQRRRIESLHQQMKLSQERENMVEGVAELLMDVPDAEAELGETARGVLDNGVAMKELVDAIHVASTQPNREAAMLALMARAKARAAEPGAPVAPQTQPSSPP